MKNYFKPYELQCPCCKGYKIDPDAVKMLNMARSVSGIPFVINSGYRCEKHNKKVGGKPTSSHMKGCAFDIKTTFNSDRSKVLNSLIAVGFRRIGIGKTFIHVDTDIDKANDVIWVYD